MTAFCTCESPAIDVEVDAGCRRCGRPVDFTPRIRAGVVFDTRFELGCVALEEPSPVDGGFDGLDSDGVRVTFSVEMVERIRHELAGFSS